MEPQRYQKVMDLFDRARELDPDERASFLDETCAGDDALRDEVVALLDMDRDPAGALADSVIETPIDHDRLEEAMSAGLARDQSPRIGGFEIVERVGEGGMGVVFRARQTEPVRRDVAIKVVRSGVISRETVARFEAERQSLARMNHPNIARVHDAGTTDEGRPYFVMEFIEGRPLADDADRRGLDVHGRVERLIKVCDAVQHAHQKGIIHRDLKPGNILVDETGEPKILDFGVARSVDPEAPTAIRMTQPGEVLGTLPYMSPEQLSGDPDAVDTRSDVYAIGVIAYELLGGRLPHDVGALAMADALEILVERTPRPLGEVATRCRGDLETIVHKALDKDRDRRYQSASGVAADLRRYLADEPISARPPSAVYQLRKFVRRNKGIVASACTVAVILVAATVVSLFYAAEARRSAIDARKNEAEAVRAADRARNVLGVFESMLGAADPAYVPRGADHTLAAALDEVVQQTDALENEPDVRAKAHDLLGTGYRRLSLFAKAKSHFEQALELYVELGERQRDIARVLQLLAQCHGALGEWDRCETTMREALATARECLDENDDELPWHVTNLAITLGVRGERLESKSMLYDALALLRKHHESDSVAIAKGLRAVIDQHVFLEELEEAVPLVEEMSERIDGNDAIHPVDLASILVARGRFKARTRRIEAAEDDLTRALEINREQFGEVHPEIANTVNGLAYVRFQQKDYVEAERLFKRALEIRGQYFGEESLFVASSFERLGLFCRQRGRLDEAESYLTRALAIRESQLGEDNLRTATVRAMIARLRREQGRLDESRSTFHASVDLLSARLGPGHPRTVGVKRDYASLLLWMGEYATAETQRRDVYEAYLDRYGGTHEKTIEANDALALALLGNRELDEARRRFEISIAYHRDTNLRPLVSMLNGYALCRLQQGDAASAVDAVREAVAVCREQWSESSPVTLMSRRNLARALLGARKLDEADEDFRAVIRDSERSWPPSHWRWGELQCRYAECLIALGRFEEAEERLTAGIEVVRKTRGAVHPLALELESTVGVLERERASAEPEDSRGASGGE